MLAETLHRTVEELQSDITLEEFLEWGSYFRLKNQKQKHGR